MIHPNSKHTPEEQKEILLLRAKLWYLVHRYDDGFKEKKSTISRNWRKAGVEGENSKQFIAERRAYTVQYWIDHKDDPERIRKARARAAKHRLKKKAEKEAQIGTLS
jgi:hypothetical protein